MLAVALLVNAVPAQSQINGRVVGASLAAAKSALPKALAQAGANADYDDYAIPLLAFIAAHPNPTGTRRCSLTWVSAFSMPGISAAPLPRSRRRESSGAREGLWDFHNEPGLAL